MDSDSGRGLRIGGAHNSPMESRAWKRVFFHPDIESSIKVCHKTSLNWNFSWRNDKGDILAERRESSLEVKGWNVFFWGAGSSNESLQALFFLHENWAVPPESSVSHEGLVRHVFFMQYAQMVLISSNPYKCLPVGSLWVKLSLIVYNFNPGPIRPCVFLYLLAVTS